MPSEHVFRIATAAMLQDVSALAGEIEHPPAELPRVLALAHPADPREQLLAKQAARCGRQLPAQLSTLPLRAVFGRAGGQPALCYPLAPLPPVDQPGDGLFPSLAPTQGARAAYLIEMFGALGSLARRTDLAHAELAYAHLLAWLARYGRCLPAQSADEPLADQARLSAAAAACLALYHATDSAAAVAAADGDARFLLVAGTLAAARPAPLARDLPGRAEASIHMRGQALFRELLRDLIGQIICERLGLPFGNLLMRLDGAFFLLAPNMPSTADTLAQLERELGGWLHADSTGACALALASAELSGAQLGAGFGAQLGALRQSLARERARPGARVLAHAGGWHEDAFVFRELRYKQGVCPHCGWLPATAGGGCPACERALTLGRQLSYARALAYYQGELPHGAVAGPAGWSFRLLAEPAPPDLGRPHLVEQINDPELGELADQPASFRYWPYHAPADLGTGAPLAQLAAQASGRALLGYLRLGIDEPARAVVPSPADTAALVVARARELELFCGAWVARLLSRAEHQQTLTLAAGSGELLLAAPWDHAAVQALEVRAQLGRFVAHSPAVALSAGVLLAQPGYPLGQAAADAAELLERSRAARWHDERGGEHAGDQLTLLGSTLHWADTPALFNEIRRLHQRAQQLPAMLLHDLVEYGSNSQDAPGEQASTGLRYKALFAFNLARTLRRSDAELYRWADRLIQSLSATSSDPAIRHIGLIATYLLLLRPDE